MYLTPSVAVNLIWIGDYVTFTEIPKLHSFKVNKQKPLEKNQFDSDCSSFSATVTENEHNSRYTTNETTTTTTSRLLELDRTVNIWKQVPFDVMAILFA
jgi:hypothetical protein